MNERGMKGQKGREKKRKELEMVKGKAKRRKVPD